MRRTNSWILCITIGLVPSCFEESKSLGLPCTDSDSCFDSQECIQGFCLATGSTVNDNCGNGEADPHEFCYRTGVAVDMPPTRFQAFGDLNGDGKLDFASMDGDKISTALNEGDAYPSTEVFDRPDTQFMWGLSLGDVSGDGIDDIVILLDAMNYTLAVMAYVNDGTGKSFTLVETSSDVMGHYAPPAIADFNGDGILDLMTVDNEDPRVAYFVRGAGGATFDLFQEIEAGLVIGSEPIAADMQNDGASELIFLEPSRGAVVILEGRVNQIPRPEFEVIVGDNPTSVVTAHLNDDDFLDLVVTDSGGEVRVLRSRDALAFGSPNTIDVPDSRGGLLFDFDGDEQLDVVSGGPEGIRFLPGFGGFEFGLPIEPTDDPNVHSMFFADANADEILDLIVYQPTEPPSRTPFVYFGDP